MMTREARQVSGYIILTIPTIVYGGYFLLMVRSGTQEHLNLNDFQKAMFRAGHAHAGVLVMFALLAQLLTDHAALSSVLKWAVRVSFPLSSALISLGFFAAALGQNITQPTEWIMILYVGVGVFIAGLVMLGIGLLKSK